MDVTLAVTEEAGPVAGADGQHLGHDRPGDLLGALGADIEAGGGVDLLDVLLGGFDALLGQVGEEAVEALSRPERADVPAGLPAAGHLSDRSAG